MSSAKGEELYLMEGETPVLKYVLIKTSRKSIGITVYIDGSVEVRAPKRATKEHIDKVLEKRMDWILKHKRDFEEQRKLYPGKKFVSGEKHLFLGDEYVLRVTRGSVNSVDKNGEFIDIVCADDSIAEQLLDEWYLSKAKEMFPQIINPVIEKFKDIYNVTPGKITVKRMKSKWGSCSSGGSISLSSEMIKTPVRYIEYVMAHELCHLIQMNHSKSYYELLNEFMPDWKERKKLTPS